MNECRARFIRFISMEMRLTDDPVTIYSHFNAQFEIGRRLIKYFAKHHTKSNTAFPCHFIGSPFRIPIIYLTSVQIAYTSNIVLCICLYIRTVNMWTWHANIGHQGKSYTLPYRAILILCETNNRFLFCFCFLSFFLFQ